jgi:hypothetical protein
MFNSYGWWQNIASFDLAFEADKCTIYTPDRQYVDSDFTSLTCLGGRTIDGANGVYKPHMSVLCDFFSEYPTIMISENICVTTLLEKDNSPEDWKEGIDYKKFTVPNAAPQVKHSCADCAIKRGEQDWAQYGKGCKYTIEYIYVEKTIYYIHQTRFIGLAAQAATDLLELCGNYKKKMKQPRLEGDMAMGEVFNTLQLATKISANAIYGIMLLLSKEVGGTITAEARSQNERAMRYLHKMTSCGASMADTDSMSPIVADIRLDPVHGALAAIQDAISGKQKDGPVKVSALIDGVTARYTTLLDHLNNGIPGVMEPARRKPARLEFEKILFSEVFLQVFLAKKMYFALKFEEGALKFHNAGLTCKKATKTPLQEAAQLIPLTMIVMYDGMCSYIKDLYTFAVVDLRVEEILTSQLKTLYEAIDDEIERDDIYVNKDAVILPVSKRQMLQVEYDSRKLRSIEARAAIKCFDSEKAPDIRKRHPPRALPSHFTTSSEKINNIETPTTSTDRLGAIECLRRGITKDQAPMFLNVQRSADVQIGTHVMKILTTCLRCPVTDAMVERQFEMRAYDRTDHAQSTVDKRKRGTKESRRLKEIAMHPLTITRMPWELIAGDESRAQYDTRQRLRLLDTLFYCDRIAKAVARERKCQFTKEYFTTPPLYNVDPHEFVRRKNRVLSVVEKVLRHKATCIEDVVHHEPRGGMH